MAACRARGGLHLPSMAAFDMADADAIAAFAGRPSQLQAAAGPRVLTPHAGELARLLQSSVDEVEADRCAVALAAAELTGCVLCVASAAAEYVRSMWIRRWCRKRRMHLH